jgi:hypothetical protein
MDPKDSRSSGSISQNILQILNLRNTTSQIWHTQMNFFIVQCTFNTRFWK